MDGGISQHYRLIYALVHSFVQGSLASQPHPVIVHACANTEYDRCGLLKFVSEGYDFQVLFIIVESRS